MLWSLLLVELCQDNLTLNKFSFINLIKFLTQDNVTATECGG